MPINLVGIVSLGVALLNLVLGFIVFFRNPRKTNNIVYAVIVSSISVWIVFTYLYNNPSLLEPKEWLKLVYLASYGMLFSQMLFAYSFQLRTVSRIIIRKTNSNSFINRRRMSVRWVRPVRDVCSLSGGVSRT